MAPYSQQRSPGCRGVVWKQVLARESVLQMFSNFFVEYTVEEKDEEALDFLIFWGGGGRGERPRRERKLHNVHYDLMNTACLCFPKIIALIISQGNVWHMIQMKSLI